MSQNTGWTIFGGVLLDLTRTLIAALLAYVVWRAYSPEFYLFGFLAAILAFAALKRFFHALFGIGKLVAGSIRWTGFQRKGAAPKADPIATKAELRRRGLTK